MTLYKDGELSSVRNYDWYEPIEGAEDFMQVLEAGEWGYSWDIFKAWYSPGQRKYFWYSDSGCSCNGYGEFVEGIADFSVGDKADLERALRKWGEYEYMMPRVSVEQALATLREFRPTKAIS